MLAKSINFFDKFNASCCGVSVGQCQVMLEIGLAEEINLSELANQLNLDSSTMSRTINNLVEQGFVERSADPQDRRYVKIKLSEKGFAFYQNMEEKITLYFTNVLQSIPAAKRGEVVESLGLLLNAFSENKCCEEDVNYEKE